MFCFKQLCRSGKTCFIKRWNSTKELNGEHVESVRAVRKQKNKEETIWRLSESDCLMRFTRAAAVAGVFREPQRLERDREREEFSAWSRAQCLGIACQHPSVCLPSETVRDQHKQSGGVGVVIKTWTSLSHVSRHVLSRRDKRHRAGGCSFLTSRWVWWWG